MTHNQLLEKLFSNNPLSRSDKARLRKELPLEKFESLICQLSQNNKKRPLTKQLYKAQNRLYPEKKQKKFRVVHTIGGNVVDSVFSGGSPGLGKKH